jgi:ATP-dependent 26S proteasome regulatory subunit
VLLQGPPGCGKTLLARAVAGETKGRFYSVSGSEFVEMFVGVGAARVRDMFETALKKPPAVIFIDELDAVGRRRGSGLGSAHDEREQTLNQLLVCLDGFKGQDRVVVIAATNRPDILDKALMRSGRFDRTVTIPELGREEREHVLAIHTKNKPLGEDVNLAELAELSDGYNGAQLENLANQAALSAVRRSGNGAGGAPKVLRSDFMAAFKIAGQAAPIWNKLDSVLIESASQLAQPTGKAVVSITLEGGAKVEGEIVWMNAQFIKVKSGDNGAGAVIAKSQIKRLEALNGTGDAAADDVVGDAWSQSPECA